MLKSIVKAEDLETSFNETKNGFLTQAIRKSAEAQHYLNLSNALRAEIEQSSSSSDLLNKLNLLDPLCEAAGVSQKARNVLGTQDAKDLVKEFFKQYITPLGDHYTDELVARYLLTQGDALGGRMRNIIGNLASEKLTKKIVASLILKRQTFKYLERSSDSWIAGTNYSIDQVPNIKGLIWWKQETARTLLYNKTVPIVRKNIDLILLNSDLSGYNKVDQKLQLTKNNKYLVLGELKGGIDPAGADEHWKTGSAALNRIKLAFSTHNPSVKTFFIGAAIEKAMAKEMYSQVNSGKINICANLTKPSQLSEFCNWLVGH